MQDPMGVYGVNPYYAQQHMLAQQTMMMYNPMMQAQPMMMVPPVNMVSVQTPNGLQYMPLPATMSTMAAHGTVATHGTAPTHGTTVTQGTAGMQRASSGGTATGKAPPPPRYQQYPNRFPNKQQQPAPAQTRPKPQQPWTARHSDPSAPLTSPPAPTLTVVRSSIRGSVMGLAPIDGFDEPSLIHGEDTNALDDDHKNILGGSDGDDDGTFHAQHKQISDMNAPLNSRAASMGNSQEVTKEETASDFALTQENSIASPAVSFRRPASTGIRPPLALGIDETELLVPAPPVALVPTHPTPVANVNAGPYFVIPQRCVKQQADGQHDFCCPFCEHRGMFSEYVLRSHLRAKHGSDASLLVSHAVKQAVTEQVREFLAVDGPVSGGSGSLEEALRFLPDDVRLRVRDKTHFEAILTLEEDFTVFSYTEPELKRHRITPDVASVGEQRVALMDVPYVKRDTERSVGMSDLVADMITNDCDIPPKDDHEIQVAPAVEASHDESLELDRTLGPGVVEAESDNSVEIQHEADHSSLTAVETTPIDTPDFPISDILDTVVAAVDDS